MASEQRPPAGPQIDNPDNLSLPPAGEAILKQMFAAHQRVVIKAELGSGFSGSRVFWVQPYADTPELPAVIKLAPSRMVEKEYQAYQHCICDKLSGAAEIRSEPVLWSGRNGATWGGLRYHLVGSGIFEVESLNRFCHRANLKDIWHVLEKRLFKRIGPLWRFSRSVPQFNLGDSYDRVLPVNLLIEPRPAPPDAELHILTPATARQQTLKQGDHVRLDDFVVTEVEQDGRCITLNAPEEPDSNDVRAPLRDELCLPAYRLRLCPVDPAAGYQLNQCIAGLEGVVTATRYDLFQAIFRGDMGWGTLSGDVLVLPGGMALPNPLEALPAILNERRQVRVAYIHGDMNLENVLVDADARDVRLIDFAMARRDHVLHDLLRLETGVVTWLLPEALAEAGFPSETIYGLYYQLHCAIRPNGHFSAPQDLHPALKKPFVMLAIIRRMARDCFAVADDWSEYYQGLTLYLMGALKFKNLDETPHAPLPKWVAFWGAAAAQKLLHEPPPQDEVFMLPLTALMDDLAGQMLDRYEIVELIGRGSMATVYRARQPKLQRDVAVKVMLPALAANPLFRQRFEREAQAIANLRHPNILTVHDGGETEDGQLYLVVDYVEGGTLRERMEETAARSKATQEANTVSQPLMSLEQVIRIVAEVADALDYAHRQGVIHRDVKPNNILMTDKDHPLLADFGLAKPVKADRRLTDTDMMLGTPDYMAPEQAQALSVDGRADIYALGVMLFEMLTGQHPYEGATPISVIFRHINDPIPPPSTLNPAIPPALDQIVARATAKSPDDRYQWAGDMAHALRAASPWVRPPVAPTLALGLDQVEPPGAHVLTSASVLASTPVTTSALAPASPLAPTSALAPASALASASAAMLTVTPAPTVANPSKAGRRRKQVTVMFADLPSFTRLLESMDAEEAYDILDAVWQRLDAIVLDYGGSIDKHVGSSIIALWGADRVREDDPVRAIQSALAMQKEIASIQVHSAQFAGNKTAQPYDAQRFEATLSLRVGISTGSVLLSTAGSSGDHVAVGDTFNLAGALQQAAPPGGILISHDTYRHVQGLFQVTPAPSLPVNAPASRPADGERRAVRAAGGTVQVYQIQRAEKPAFRTATRGIPGLKTRMVGRETELLALQNMFHETMEDAETRLVTLVGDAGVGKSRLLDEFVGWMERLPQPVLDFKGRATPEMVDLPYGIIRNLFAARFDILESDNAATVRQKFHAGTAGQLEPGRADLVGHLVGFDFRTAGSQTVLDLLGSPSFSQIAMAYFTNYIRGVAEHPCVILLEDIHWADDSSLDLVDHVLASIPQARLLVVCLARPTLFERRPNWGEGRTAYTRLDLKPLSRRASRALVKEILQKVDKVPDNLRDLIVEGAEGNPFYVEEFIKILIEDGVIVPWPADAAAPGDQVWHVLPERLKDIRVPSTLTGVLQARLDSLPGAEKAILQRASVVGRLFWDALVVELARDWIGPAEVTALLESLRSRELIFRRERSAFSGALEYTFKHNTLRDVVYDTVLIKQRHAYHAQVAGWLEANAGERMGEYLGLIATHYAQAGQLRQAAGYLRRLGEELYAVNAFRDAVSAFERALASLLDGHIPERAGLLAKLANAYAQVSDYPAARQHFGQARKLAFALNDLKLEAAAFNGLGWVAMDQGSYDEAERYLALGLALARQLDDRESAALALRNLGFVAFRRGSYEDAEICFEESLIVYKEIGGRQGIANALTTLGMVAFMRKEYPDAQRHYEESLAIFQQTGEQRGGLVCLNNLGEVARRQGKYAEARQYYEESLPICEEMGLRRGVALCLSHLGCIYASLGEEVAAWHHLRQALSQSLAIHALPIALDALIGIAGLHAKAGRYRPAADLLGLAISHPALPVDVRHEEGDPLLIMLRDKLPPDQFQTAIACGQSLDLQTVADDLLAASPA